jgi:hypothetical protein
MWENFDQLIARGYLYPFRAMRHFELASRLLGNGNIHEIARSLEDRAKSKGPQSDCLVISDEDICMRPSLARLAQLQEYFNVKVIYFLRRQDLWLESWFFQNITWQWNKNLCHLTFDEFLAVRAQFHWIHYDAYVRMLEGIFGSENVLLNVFEREQMPGGPIVAFCNQIGLTNLNGFTKPPRKNSSMSAEMVEFMRHLPLGTFPHREREMIRASLENVDRTVHGNIGTQSKLIMPIDQRVNIMAEFNEDNMALAQRYFNRDELFLEPLPGKDALLAKMSIPQDSQALIEKFIVPMLQEMVSNGTIKKTAP